MRMGTKGIVRMCQGIGMQRKASSASVLAIVALCLCLLAGCSSAGGSSTQASDSSSASESSSSSSTEGSSAESGSKDATNEGDLGSIYDGMRDWKGYVSRESAKEILTVTIDGKEYGIPFAMSELTDAGYDIVEGAVEDDEVTLEPTVAIGALPLALGEGRDEGTNEGLLYVSIYNPSDEAVSWEDATVIGVCAKSDLDEIESGDAKCADLRTSFGIDLGSSMDDAIALFGPWDEDGGEYASVMTYEIRTLDDEDSSTKVGDVVLEQSEGTIVQIAVVADPNELALLSEASS